ncbi:MAG TPA: PRC-barrel domain-containing protein [Bacteroidales bacterium]|nr:PRC-barrel domain-containing protein [Bacteroidales bacterium]
MLTNGKTLTKYRLNGLDEDVGSIKEFFFDDKYWTVRYLVVNTGNWFNRKQVLISPYFLGNVDHTLEFINVNLRTDEIKNSPPVESKKPVSRQYEQSYYDYYGAPVYWGGPYAWGSFPTLNHDRESWKSIKKEESSWDPNLRSSDDVSGHSIHASDGEIGQVDDFIIDDESWTIRYLVIDTRKWLPGKKVLISPQWIDRISWDDSKVYVNLTQDSIRNAPEYDKDSIVTREYERELHGYYKRQGYWAEEPVGTEYSRRV